MTPPVTNLEIAIPPTALILGTLHGQAEAIERLRVRGWTVHSCGHRADGPGVDAADSFSLIDIVDANAVAALAQRLDADVVYSVGSDIAMPTVAVVSERLGLVQFHDVEITETLHRKANLRAFLERNDLSPVAHRVAQEAADVDGFDVFPAIVKPSDSQGQRGLRVVTDVAEARAAVADAISFSATRTAVIEEYLDGPEVSVHVFVVDGHVELAVPTDRFVWDGPLTGVAEGHAIPARSLTAAQWPAIDELIRAVVSTLGIRTGPLYFQLKLTSRGARIIEIAPRLDGCHLWRLLELHTGFNILDRCFDLLAGEAWQPVELDVPEVVHELWFMLGNPNVPFHPADHPPSSGAGVVVYEELQVAEGELPRDANGIVSRLGYRIYARPTV